MSRESLALLLGQERDVSDLGQRAIGTFLEERELGRRRAERETVRAAEAEAAEAAALAKVQAATTKAERDVAAKELEFERRKKLKATPQARTPEELKRIETQIELNKARTRKIESDLKIEGTPNEALTPSERLSLDKELKKSEEMVLSNPNNPASIPDMEFVNKRGNNPYVYIAKDVRDPSFWLPESMEDRMPSIERVMLPQGVTMDTVNKQAALNNMTLEEFLRTWEVTAIHFK